jgi:predicted RNA binding protein YcfA (HicA-like mRNA interferase family)
MSKFPINATKAKVVKTLERLGFSIVREREHIAMIRENSDGTRTPLTLPNHSTIKSSTLRTICSQAGISREDFLKAFYDR